MGKIKVLLVIIFAVAAIGASAMFYMKKVEAEPETEKAISAEELAELSIDTDVITTNLASASNFAIVQFNILLSSEEAKEETEKRTPEVRAAIISTIAGLTKDQLIGEDGINILEKELSAKLGKIVETGKVERVLVTEFKIQ
ncbi:flagellar basal body-associated FliL family protein [Paenisporosarcina sp. OV554]|uniref:flagellar basal body-associated FliL family protein n=1 Tax=Paenisporosarcina sp. OV554 TaxID=2135694 RepID=UPI000D35AC59|nr:flagellar basal body-associated FliL family protein [Paenisporosarcina sp. OV554]PUB14683.1 flagellar FliL protein [Paenisporosarcina sp. OV554]